MDWLIGLILITFIGLLVYHFLIKMMGEPLELRGIPSQSSWDHLISLFQDKPYDVKCRETTLDLLRQFGITKFWTPGKWIVLTSSVESANRLYTELETFPKTIPQENHPNMVFSKFMGINLVFSNGEEWRKMRRVINPLFKRQFPIEIITEVMKKFMKVVDSRGGKGIDIKKYIQKITMDALGKGIMGVDFNSVIEDHVPFIDCYNQVLNRAGDPIYMIFPILDHPNNPFRSYLFQTLHELECHFKEILESKRSLIRNSDTADLIGDNRTDLLTMLCLAGEDEEDGLSDKEIRDNIMIFLIAGHDTTAFTICAALHFLAIYPDIQSRAREEIVSILNTKDPSSSSSNDVTPTLDQIRQMPYLTSILRETMRLYPAINRLPFRTSTRDTELDGHFLPKGTELTLDIYAMHRDPKNFPNPDTFDPLRFYDPVAKTSLPDPTGYTPFGGGTRYCIGRQFSLLEQRTVIAMLLYRYQLQYSHPITPDPHSPTSLKLSKAPFFITAPFEFDLLPLQSQ